MAIAVNFPLVTSREERRKAEMTLGSAGCAGHVQQLGSESLLPNLMEVKG
jgi:hypothetical protein